MTCLICKRGQVDDGKTTVALHRGSCTVIFKDVPAKVCDDCGEYYLDEKTTAQLIARADVAVKGGAEVEIIRFAA